MVCLTVDVSKNRKTEICNICGGNVFAPLARRSDDIEILLCQKCGMGALEVFPFDPMIIYNGNYYDNCGIDVDAGYSDYDVSSEHGVLWAAELVKIIRHDGRVLDIGCANGFLLKALGDGYEISGIEVNESAAERARVGGVRIIGNDIFERDLFPKYAGYFDAITAIAVFEHVTDFRKAIEVSLQMLKPDGVLIFEVPLVSEFNSNFTWFNTSLEHLYYPTTRSIKYLFGEELNIPMVGGELIIRDYASTFIGIVTPCAASACRIKKLYNRIMFEEPSKLPKDERRVQLLLKVIHAADAKPEHIPFVPELFQYDQLPPFLSRCLDLWGGAIRRQQSSEDYLKKVEEAKTWHLDNSNAAVAERDAVVAERDAVVAGRDAALAERDAVVAERDAAQEELYVVYHSPSWRIAWPLRMLASKIRLVSAKIGVLVSVVLPALTWIRFRKGLKLLAVGDVTALRSSIKYATKEKTKRIDPTKVPEQIAPTHLSPGQPLVSVVIPCFNYGRFVVGAIDSVLSQTLKNVEIIVVDGGSTDLTTIETLKVLKRPRTTINFREGKHLVGDNRNFGIETAKGRYICCLDADDTLDPTYLEKAVFYLETYLYDIVSPSINFVGAREGHIDTLEYPDLNDMENGNHVITCAVFRKHLWESSGGYFDVGIGKHHVAEDWDFWLRLATKGARIRNISKEYLFNYRVHTGGSLSSAADVRSIEDQKNAILERNRGLLTPKAIQNSALQQSRYLRCNPEESALAISYDEQVTVGKKVLLLAIPFSVVGGAERLLSGLCRYLASNDWRIVVVTTLEQNTSFGSTIEWFKEITPEVYELTKFLELKEREDFIKYLIKSRKPDCLVNAGSRLIYEMLPEIELANESLCVVDLLFNTEGHVKSHIEYKRFISFAFAESQEVFVWLLDVAGWPADKIKRLSSGIDLLHFQPTPRPQFLIDKLDIVERDLVVGFSGRLSREKGPDVFLEVARLCDGIPNIRFVMTGAGPMSDELIEKIKLLRSSVKFDYVGLVDDVEAYLALYDVLILPSRFDGRPFVVMEALACGVPVIASNVGALSELIEDGRNGYLVPAGNAKIFAEKVRGLAQDRSLLGKLKIAARSTSESKFDAVQAYREYEAALRDVVQLNRSANVHGV